MIPHGARCLICGAEATHLLSLRMRRDDTGADWAPNLPAYFCTGCATDGCHITIEYTPTDSGRVDVDVLVRHVVTRDTPIRRRGGVKL